MIARHFFFEFLALQIRPQSIRDTVCTKTRKNTIFANTLDPNTQ